MMAGQVQKGEGQGLPAMMMYGGVGLLVAVVAGLVVFNIARTLWLAG